MVALTWEPGESATMGPSAPVSTMSPARRGAPRSASVRASHAAALRGWPRHAAPAPTEATAPKAAQG